MQLERPTATIERQHSGGRKDTSVRGIVKRLVRNKGFGFLRGEDGIERFFHRSSVRPWVDFDNLAEEDAVLFEEDRSPRGPRAKNIDIEGAGTHDQATETVTAPRENVSAGSTRTQEAEATIRAKADRRYQGAGIRPGRQHV